jgi:uncharacterized membrane protein
MIHKNAVVAVFPNHTDAEVAVKELQASNFNMKQLSIVGKDYQTNENVIGFYNTGNRVQYWGKLGAFWGGLWGIVLGSGFFLIPGVGPVVVAGHLVSCIVAALEGAVVCGGLSALGAGFYSLGIPKDSILQYETAIRSDKFVLVAHGSGEEVAMAKKILQQNGSAMVESYALESEPALMAASIL